MGLSYLYSQPVDVGIHLRREHDIRFWRATEEERIANNNEIPADLLLLVLTKSRYTGNTGHRCWFRPDWENWILGQSLTHDEVLESVGTIE